MRKKFKHLFLLCILLCPAMGMAQTASPGSGQGWPSRPIRFIVPFPPGGGTDVNARIIAPVTITGEVPNGLVVHPTLPAKTLKDLIALAKQRPRELNYGSSGAGAGDHLAAEMLSVMAGIRMTHVPYKGGPLAMVDLMAGNIQLIFATLATGMPYIRAGRVRTLAVAGAQRFALLPEVPTVAEAGVPGYAIHNWAGVFVAAGTPRPIIDRLNVEIVKALAAPDVRQKLLEMGLVAATNTPDQFASFIQSETVKWAKVVKDANLKLD